MEYKEPYLKFNFGDRLSPIVFLIIMALAFLILFISLIVGPNG